MTSPWAQAAKEIRNEIKALGVTANVKSEGYGGGWMIDVYITSDERISTIVEIKRLAASRETTVGYVTVHYHGGVAAA